MNRERKLIGCAGTLKLKPYLLLKRFINEFSAFKMLAFILCSSLHPVIASFGVWFKRRTASVNVKLQSILLTEEQSFKILTTVFNCKNIYGMLLFLYWHEVPL